MAAAILGERPTAATVGGGALIALGIWLVNLDARKRGQDALRSD
jgi:drug/metabolite transporter (DMT)-like permease